MVKYSFAHSFSTLAFSVGCFFHPTITRFDPMVTFFGITFILAIHLAVFIFAKADLGELDFMICEIGGTVDNVGTITGEESAGTMNAKVTYTLGSKTSTATKKGAYTAKVWGKVDPETHKGFGQWKVYGKDGSAMGAWSAVQ